jgi:hypothetical protein
MMKKCANNNKNSFNKKVLLFLFSFKIKIIEKEKDVKRKKSSLECILLDVGIRKGLKNEIEIILQIFKYFWYQLKSIF